jgi:hypothetical protein
MPSMPSHQSSSIAVGPAAKNKAARQNIRKSRNRTVIRKAFRETYACGERRNGFAIPYYRNWRMAANETCDAARAGHRSALRLLRRPTGRFNDPDRVASRKNIFACQRGDDLTDVIFVSSKAAIKFAAEAVLQNNVVTHLIPHRREAGLACTTLEKRGYAHLPVVEGGDLQVTGEYLPIVHLVFSDLKAWLQGTHHGRVDLKHLQIFLNEFTFRFNRRFYPFSAFRSLLGIGANGEAPIYEGLGSGKWKHRKLDRDYD